MASEREARFLSCKVRSQYHSSHPLTTGLTLQVQLLRGTSYPTDIEKSHPDMQVQVLAELELIGIR